MKKTGAERRLHPRLDKKIPLKVVANGFDFATSTQNISCLGAYCHITKYVPPFTRVAIKLSLPVAEKGKRKNYDISCDGVLVRTEDDADGGFNIAIFFNRIKEPQRKVISRYVNQFLPGKSVAAVSAKPRWGK